MTRPGEAGDNTEGQPDLWADPQRGSGPAAAESRGHERYTTLTDWTGWEEHPGTDLAVDGAVRLDKGQGTSEQVRG